MHRMGRPVAFVRKSVIHRDSRTISPEVQEAEVRKLADRYGDKDILILSDLGRSGRRKEKRPDYQRLLTMVEAGEVSAIYAYSMSRLSRSVKDYAALSELCVERRVPVRFYKEGEQDYTTATGRLIAGLLAHVAQFVADIASEAAKETIATRTANGQHHGEPAYGARDGEDPGAVVAAFLKAGSYHGAARILNATGIPTRRGRPWRSTTVRVILRAQAPGIIPPGQVQRAKSAPPFRLARLLRCPSCHRLMTGVMQRGRPRYVCIDAFDGVAHPGPKSISEVRILEWVKQEAARFDRARILELEAPDDERAALEDRLAKLSTQHEMGVITDAELRERVTAIQDALGRLQERTDPRTLPDAIEWETDAPAAVNAVLRAYWHHVDLDVNLMPVRAAWRFDPEAAA
jgi:DNA invertase Pin-like site-specific DNA recombinase